MKTRRQALVALAPLFASLPFAIGQANAALFRSGAASYGISVNGQRQPWSKPKIGYEQVVKLAFPDGRSGNRFVVSWTNPSGEKGRLLPGRPIDVISGMLFDVRKADK